MTTQTQTENQSSFLRLILNSPPKVLQSRRTASHKHRRLLKELPKDAWRAMVTKGTDALSQNLQLE